MTYVPGTENAVLPFGSQFEGGQSAYLCVFYGVADIAASGPVGGSPAQSWEWVDQTADGLANKIQGAGANVTSQGASTTDEQNACSDLGLHWQVLQNTIQAIKDAIDSGLLVLLCGAETGFVDSAIGRTPYSWPPTGNHCIVVSGYTTTGNLIVHDYAAVGNSWQPGSTRTYIASAVQIVSALAVTPLWSKSSAPVPTHAPLKGKPAMIPTGWTDDGTTLSNPKNKFVIKGAKRAFVMAQSAWFADNVPVQNDTEYPVLELSNTSIGPGTAQAFLYGTRLEEAAAHDNGDVFVGYTGSELLFLYNLIQQAASSPQAITSGSSPVAPALLQLVSDMSDAMQKFATNIQLPIATPVVTSSSAAPTAHAATALTLPSV